MPYDVETIQKIGRDYEDALTEADKVYAAATHQAREELAAARRAASEVYDQAIAQVKKEVTA